MDKKVILITAMLLFLVGCTSTIDVTSIVKSLPQVRDFLSQYPDAELKVVLWNTNYTSSQINEVQDTCGKQMEVKSYYYATVTKGLFNLRLWIDKDTMEINCLIKAGGNATGNNDTEITEDNNNGVSDTGAIEDNNDEITCEEYCAEQSQVQCAGEWNITGIYPECNCGFICDTEEPEPTVEPQQEEVEFEDWTDGKEGKKITLKELIEGVKGIIKKDSEDFFPIVGSLVAYLADKDLSKVFEEDDDTKVKVLSNMYKTLLYCQNILSSVELLSSAANEKEDIDCRFLEINGKPLYAIVKYFLKPEETDKKTLKRENLDYIG